MSEDAHKRGRGRPPLSTKRVARRVQPYLPEDMHVRLVDYCSAKRQTQSAVIHTAVKQYLDAINDHTLVMRRLDRLGRANDRLQRDIELLSEAFGLFVQFWFAHTPSIPADARDGARRMAASRYKQFAQHLAEQFGRGRRFIDDLPRELLAEDSELEAMATASDKAAPAQEGQ